MVWFHNTQTSQTSWLLPTVTFPCCIPSSRSSLLHALLAREASRWKAAFCGQGGFLLPYLPKLPYDGAPAPSANLEGSTNTACERRWDWITPFSSSPRTDQLSSAIRQTVQHLHCSATPAFMASSLSHLHWSWKPASGWGKFRHPHRSEEGNLSICLPRVPLFEASQRRCCCSAGFQDQHRFMLPKALHWEL